MFSREIFTLNFSWCSILLEPIFPDSLCEKIIWKKHSMLDTLFLVSVLAQQCLDLIKDLVQVLGILGMNAEYNLAPVEASRLHRQSNPAYLWIHTTKKPRHFKWHQYILHVVVYCELLLDTDFSHWKDQVWAKTMTLPLNNDNNNRWKRSSGSFAIKLYNIVL